MNKFRESYLKKIQSTSALKHVVWIGKRSERTRSVALIVVKIRCGYWAAIIAHEIIPLNTGQASVVLLRITRIATFKTV